jgi:hypothetical protein
MAIDKSSFDLFKKRDQVDLIESESVATQKTSTISSTVFERQILVEKAKPTIIPKKGLEPTNKFESMLPVTLRIQEEHFMDLKQIENSIMRSRSRSKSDDRERITTNSILRCLVASFIDRIEMIDLEGVENEEILKERIQKIFKNVPLV